MNKKIAVVYKSATGFTKKYAEAISEETGAELINFKDCPKTKLKALTSEYDIIIYGSRLHAGMIDGIKKAKSLFYGKGKSELIVFATGAMPNAEAEKGNILELTWKNNFTPQELEKIPHFYFQGGLCYEKMSFADRMMMKAFRSMLKNKKNKTDSDRAYEKAAASSYDIFSKEFVKPLIKFILSNY